MEEFDLDIVPLIAPVIRINTPEGVLRIHADMSPVLFRRYANWLAVYEAWAADQESQNPPDMEAVFPMAAEAVKRDIEIVRTWGHTVCVRILDFLAVRYLESRTSIPNQTNGSTPPSAAPGSRSRRKAG